MSTLFTEEQIRALSENPFTEFVSENTLRFTLEFKKLFVDEFNQGKTVRSIFTDAGYDPKILGKSRMKSFSHRVRVEMKSDTGLHSGYKDQKRHPDLADYSAMTQKDAMLHMQNEIQYLHQEIEFIKKIIALGRGGEQKP